MKCCFQEDCFLWTTLWKWVSTVSRVSCGSSKDKKRFTGSMPSVARFPLIQRSRPSWRNMLCEGSPVLKPKSCSYGSRYQRSSLMILLPTRSCLPIPLGLLGRFLSQPSISKKNKHHNNIYIQVQQQTFFDFFSSLYFIRMERMSYMFIHFTNL